MGVFLGYFLNIRSARCRFSLSPGLRLRSLYGQSSTKEASAEERVIIQEEEEVAAKVKVCNPRLVSF